MEFKYLEKNCNHPLIDHFYRLKISEEDLPFSTLIVPLGQNNITYVFTEENQIANIKNRKIPYKGLIVTGQICSSYQIEVISKSDNIGFAMKPTSLYKILNQDISKFNDQHIHLNEINEKIYGLFSEAFIKNRFDENAMMQAVYEIFDKLELYTDINTAYIDKSIDYITKKEGLLQVNDLLKIIPLSQKTLEVQFKKIVGITPGKYIRHYRFTKLMQKYGSGKYTIADLMYMFDYYDKSHFSRDFKFFVGQTSNEYFKKDFPLIKEYLR